MIRCVIWLAAAGLACGSERRSEAAHAGIPDRAPPSTSTVDPDSTELRFTSVSAGEEFTCGLAQEGRAYCWGSNEVGQLGDGSKMGELVNRPYAAPVAGGHAFAAISAGDVHVCALTADGQAFCWGYDVNGRSAADVRPHPGWGRLLLGALQPSQRRPRRPPSPRAHAPAR